MALLGTLALFICMPFLRLVMHSPAPADHSTNARATILMTVYNPPQPRRKPSTPPLRSNPAKGYSRLSSRSLSIPFSPDLRVSGGSAAAVSATDISMQVFEEGQTDEPAIPLSRTPVTLPARVQQMGLSGTVSVIITVDRQGEVSDIAFEKLPHPLFAQPVERAVRQWRFSPARNNGVPVAVRVRQQFAFEAAY
jgi:protein TonB